MKNHLMRGRAKNRKGGLFGAGATDCKMHFWNGAVEADIPAIPGTAIGLGARPGSRTRPGTGRETIQIRQSLPIEVAFYAFH